VTASSGGSSFPLLLTELARSGDVRFAIDVALVDAVGDVVAEMTVRWAAHRDLEA